MHKFAHSENWKLHFRSNLGLQLGPTFRQSEVLNAYTCSYDFIPTNPLHGLQSLFFCCLGIDIVIYSLLFDFNFNVNRP